jgi:hypothetical protein
MDEQQLMPFSLYDIHGTAPPNIAATDKNSPSYTLGRLSA